jgi:alanyl-tRNA synthetase
MAMSYKLLLAPAALVLISGCQTSPALPQAGSLASGFGEVVKYNTAIQVIDPDPVYPEGGAQPGDHGEKGANAVKRYRTDQVKETEMQSTGGVTGVGTGPR